MATVFLGYRWTAYDRLSASCIDNYTVSQKNKTPNSHQLLSDFQSFFTSGLSSKFATNSCLNIPPRLKHVATLPCEI